MYRFAVIDLETTGLYPGGHDRVLEIAVVGLDDGLASVGEFTTLLNPGRDLGPAWLHGIQAADVLQAPAFLDLAGHILDHLRDAVVVGHNVTFDLRFLEAEVERCGARMSRPPYFDTMSTALRLGSASRQLAEACDLFGIAVPNVHSALEDARATAQLFRRCVEHLGPDHVSALIRYSDTQAYSWPRLPVRAAPVPRAQAVSRRLAERPFLATLVTELPASGNSSGDWQPYYAVLDRALEDRRITPDEAEALNAAAHDAGLSGSDVQAANEAYLRTVIATAFRDQVLTDLERRDLNEVARLLNLEAALPELLREAEASPPPRSATTPCAELRGRTVCFTGAMNAVIDGERATREKATEIAEANGMIVVKGVTKRLDYLVLADPDSQSSKADKARHYGTRLMAESVFWGLMGVSTES